MKIYMTGGLVLFERLFMFRHSISCNVRVSLPASYISQTLVVHRQDITSESTNCSTSGQASFTAALWYLWTPTSYFISGTINSGCHFSIPLYAKMCLGLPRQSQFPPLKVNNKRFSSDVIICFGRTGERFRFHDMKT